MLDNQGGRRQGAGRPKGSKNKETIAREAVAEALDIEDAEGLEQAVHRRGHQLLLELERIAIDPTQNVAARIMAAKVALPFLLPKQSEPQNTSRTDQGKLFAALQAGRERVRLLRTIT